jgi:hypothetical protein
VKNVNEKKNDDQISDVISCRAMRAIHTSCRAMRAFLTSCRAMRAFPTCEAVKQKRGCWKCDKEGHVAAHCSKPKKQESRVNAATVGEKTLFCGNCRRVGVPDGDDYVARVHD